MFDLDQFVGDLQDTQPHHSANTARARRRGDRMTRRDLIALLGTTAAVWPLRARAQQPDRMRHIGVLLNLSENDVEAQRLVTAFRQGLAQQGWADGRNDRLPLGRR
jgi:hypothetical protein